MTKLDKNVLKALEVCSGSGNCTECPCREGYNPTLTCKDLLEKISEYIKSLERSNNDDNLHV